MGSCLLLALSPALGLAADARFSLSAAAVTASSDDGNIPSHAVDGDMSTRWSAKGDGQWIQFDLGALKKVAFVKIAFLEGASRTFTFDIQTSSDGATFTSVRSGVASGLTDGLQTFDFTDVASARYVRLVGYGNTSNTWNSYLEVEIHGSAAETTAGPVVNVSTAAQLTAALANATAGTTIVLANGTYTKSGAFSLNKSGTASSLITLRAANRGQALISGGAWLQVSGASYVVIRSEERRLQPQQEWNRLQPHHPPGGEPGPGPHLRRRLAAGVWRLLRRHRGAEVHEHRQQRRRARQIPSCPAHPEHLRTHGERDGGQVVDPQGERKPPQPDRPQ